jgi:hypothetical protein
MHHMCLVLMSEFDETGRTQTASLILIKFVFLATSFMVGLGGLEPPTSPLSGVRSSHLSYRPGF